MNILIACSSSDDIPKKYIEDCEKYIETLLKNNNLVFGTYDKGLMGISYNIALKNKNSIVGVCPETYIEDFKSLKCTKEIVAKSVSNRTEIMFKESDALIFLPGGIGTLFELFSAIESKRCHEFDKPIIIYNSCRYFDKLFKFLDKVYLENFTKDYIKDEYYVSNSVKDTLEYINNYNKGKDYENNI